MLSTRNEDKSFRRLMGLFALGMLLFYMLLSVAPLRWTDLYNSYGRAFIFAAAGIYFVKQGLKGCTELKLLIAYAIWLFVTRLLNTDFYMQNDYDLVISRILCVLMLATGLVLEKEERRLLLDVLIAIAGGFYFVTALLGLYAVIFGVYFALPPENVYFGINSTYMVNMFAYMVAWDTNRTISAVWFYLGWCMMIYEYFRCHNKLWRIPIVLALFVFHMAIAFCFCRSIKLAVCGNVIMLIILWGMEHVKVKKLAGKIAIIALIAAVSFPITYKSFDVLTSASAAAYNALDPDIERSADQYMSDYYMENTEDGQSFEDHRQLKESVSNISNRGEIYLSVIPSFRYDPMRLLIGEYNSKLMDVPNMYQSYPYYHMHNFLIQTLMLTGVPGLLLAAAFCLLLVIKMIRLFFSTHPEATKAVKSLTLPLAGILVYGMFEIILFTASADERAATDFRELCFFLLAGILLAYCRDILPKKEKN